MLVLNSGRIVTSILLLKSQASQSLADIPETAFMISGELAINRELYFAEKIECPLEGDDHVLLHMDNIPFTLVNNILLILFVF